MSINDSVSRKQLLKKETLGFMWHHPSLPGLVMSGLVLWLGREAKDATKAWRFEYEMTKLKYMALRESDAKHRQNMTHI